VDAADEPGADDADPQLVCGTVAVSHFPRLGGEGRCLLHRPATYSTYVGLSSKSSTVGDTNPHVAVAISAGLPA
jgi:hypothetical protein